jgi:TRAP-type C4-dicarboxylate transport system permease small subunit
MGKLVESMLFLKMMDKLNRVLEVFVGLALGAMTLVVFYQVLVRFVLTTLGQSISAPWTEELARYLMIWLVFIGGAVAARKADSNAVETLINAVPPLAGKIIKIGAHLTALIFYALIFVIGWEWVKFGLTETAPVMKIHMSYVYSSMFVGAALSVLNTISVLVDAYVNNKDIRETIDEEVVEAIAEYKRDGEELSV